MFSTNKTKKFNFITCSTNSHNHPSTMCNNPRKRKQPDDFVLQRSSLLIKKARYATVMKFKSDLNDAKNPINQAISKNLFDQMLHYTDITPDIIQNIVEYAVGWIKQCPECMIGEILILPSSFKDIEIGIKCCYCNAKLYIHLCDECHQQFHVLPNFIWFYMKTENKFPYHLKNSWWIYHKPLSETYGKHEPHDNTCIECINQNPAFWYDWNKLCVQCKFKCSACGNTFCKANHIGQQCSHCSTIFCVSCKYWHDETIVQISNVLVITQNTCINCICNNLINKFDAVTKYSNLKDKLMHCILFKSLQSTNIIKKGKISPRIVGLISEFANGCTTYCHHENCINGTINVLFEQKSYFSRVAIECDFAHLNHIHHCDLCKFNYWYNSISPSQYLSVHHSSHIAKYYSNYDIAVNTKQKIIIEKHICSYCLTNNSRLIKLCDECSFKCDDCDSILCNNHLASECILCNGKFCDLEYSDFRQCRMCQQYACPDCQIYYCEGLMPDPLIECYDLYQVCDRCYSPEISRYYPASHQYKACLNIVQAIISSNTCLSWQAINIIAVYAKMMSSTTFDD